MLLYENDTVILILLQSMVKLTICNVVRAVRQRYHNEKLLVCLCWNTINVQTRMLRKENRWS